MRQEGEGSMRAFKNQDAVLVSNEKWVDDKLPEKPGEYLVTIYGDSIGENYIESAEYICKPWHCKNAFILENTDITEYVIAWIPYPKVYNKSHKPILSDNENDWIDHHL